MYNKRAKSSGSRTRTTWTIKDHDKKLCHLSCNLNCYFQHMYMFLTKNQLCTLLHQIENSISRPLKLRTVESNWRFYPAHTTQLMCDEIDLTTIDKEIRTLINWHKICLFQPLDHLYPLVRASYWKHKERTQGIRFDWVKCTRPYTIGVHGPTT